MNKGGYDRSATDFENEATQTNLTYHKILENIEVEKKAAKSPDKFKSGDYTDLLASGKDDSDGGGIENDDDSTDASANSDSEESQKGTDQQLKIF